MTKLNLGCGPYKAQGYINIDHNPNWKPDLVLDITKGLPYGVNSIDEIRAHHVLEHLETEGMLNVLADCYRVLKPQGILSIVVPLMDFELDHRQIFDSDTLDVLYRPGEMRTYFNKDMEWKLVGEVILGAVTKASGKIVNLRTYTLRPVK